jgi:hypothetical protein
MKSPMNRILPTCLFVLLAAASVPGHAQSGLEKVGQAGFKFLDIPVGARQAALARAGVAIVDGPNAVFSNPALVATVEGTQASLSTQSWLADIDHHAGVVSHGLGEWGVASATVVAMSYGDLVATRRGFSAADPFVEMGTFSPDAFAVGLGWTRQWTDRFAWGAHLRYAKTDYGSAVIGNDLTDSGAGFTRQGFDASALVLDFGTIYETGFEDLRIAMSLRNFSQELKVEEAFFPLPLTFTVGAAMDVLRLGGVDPAHSLTLEVDTVAPRDYGLRTHVGMEYSWNGLAYLRGGLYANHDEASHAVGVGLRPRMGAVTINLEYAYTDYGVFDPVHSLTLEFGR